MDPKVQKWRDHFAQCEAEQLRRFPLNGLDSSLEHAQYEVAMDYFKTKWQPFQNHQRVMALRADEPTRCAFYDSFATGKGEWFCFRHDEWDALFKGRARGSGMWPFQSHRHEFLPCDAMIDRERSQRFSEQLGDFSEGSLHRRYYGFRDALRAGFGGSDLWHWNGTTLTHLPDFDSSWVS